MVRVDGPERLANEWWHEESASPETMLSTTPPVRDYYRIEDRQGRRFWLFRAGHYEAARPRWYVHGVFA